MLPPYLRLVLPSGLFVSDLPVKNSVPFCFCPIPATYPAHLTFIYSIAMMMMMIIIIIIIIIKKVMIYWRKGMRLHAENKLREKKT